jgi:Spy/CpxP family protein refolding chaperone
MKRELKAVAFGIMFLFSCVALAQEGPPPPGGSFSTERGQMRKREGESREIMIRDGGDRGRVELRMRDEGGGPFPPGKWWKNSELVQKIGISEAQVQQMEKIFQDTRLKLIDMHANLQKQEALMEPLVESDRPDETKVLQQIDKVASARAELEKTNAQMMLGIRKILTVDQWNKLKALPQTRGPIRINGPGNVFFEGGHPPLPPGEDDLL